MPFLSAETCGAAHKPTQMLKKVFLTMPTSLARSDNVLLTGSCKEIELRVLSTIGTGSYLFCNLSQKCNLRVRVLQSEPATPALIRRLNHHPDPVLANWPGRIWLADQKRQEHQRQ